MKNVGSLNAQRSLPASMPDADVIAPALPQLPPEIILGIIKKSMHGQADAARALTRLRGVSKAFRSMADDTLRRDPVLSDSARLQQRIWLERRLNAAANSHRERTSDQHADRFRNILAGRRQISVDLERLPANAQVAALNVLAKRTDIAGLSLTLSTDMPGGPAAAIQGLGAILQSNSATNPELDLAIAGVATLGEGERQILVTLLAGQRGLRVLNCDHQFIDSAQVMALAGALGTATRLKQLDLDGAPFSEEAFATLLNSLQEHGTIESLMVAECGLGDACIEQLAAILQDPDRLPRLTLLDLSNNDFGDVGAIALAESLMHRNGLKHLDISGNAYRDAAAPAFSRLIDASESLEHLDVSNSNLTNEVSPEISTAAGRVARRRQFVLEV